MRGEEPLILETGEGDEDGAHRDLPAADVPEQVADLACEGAGIEPGDGEQGQVLEVTERHRTKMTLSVSMGKRTENTNDEWQSDE